MAFVNRPIIYCFFRDLLIDSAEIGGTKGLEWTPAEKPNRYEGNHRKFHCHLLARGFDLRFPRGDGALLDEDLPGGAGRHRQHPLLRPCGCGNFHVLCRPLAGKIWHQKNDHGIGAILCGLSVLIIAYASNLYMLYLWAFLTGTSSAFIYIPALTTVQRWYPMRRGLVSGIVNLLIRVVCCNHVTPLPLSVRIDGLCPYESIGGGSCFHRWHRPLPNLQRVPKRFPLLNHLLHKGEQRPFINLAESLTVRESLRTKSFWFLWLTWAFQGAAGIAMVTLSTAYGLSKGFSMESAVVILTAFNITNGGSRIIMGFLSDRVGRNLAMSLTFLAAGGAYFILPHVDALVRLSHCSLLLSDLLSGHCLPSLPLWQPIVSG